MDTEFEHYINRNVNCYSTCWDEKNIPTKQQNPVFIMLYKPDAGLCGNQTRMLILLIHVCSKLAGNCELWKILFHLNLQMNYINTIIHLIFKLYSVNCLVNC